MTDYSLEIEERPGYLHVKVTGINSRENVFGYTQQIFETCQTRNRSAVLIEEDLSGPSVPLSVVLQLVDARVTNARQLHLKLAFVDVNIDHDLSRMEFAEDRAVNQGVKMRLFGTVEAARDWLEGRG